MVELADIFRRYAPDYIERFSDRMLPSHHRAIQDIIACRTEHMGGHLYCCENPDCEQLVYAWDHRFHSQPIPPELIPAKTIGTTPPRRISFFNSPSSIELHIVVLIR